MMRSEVYDLTTGFGKAEYSPASTFACRPSCEPQVSLGQEKESYIYREAEIHTLGWRVKALTNNSRMGNQSEIGGVLGEIYQIAQLPHRRFIEARIVTHHRRSHKGGVVVTHGGCTCHTTADRPHLTLSRWSPPPIRLHPRGVHLRVSSVR